MKNLPLLLVFIILSKQLHAQESMDSFSKLQLFLNSNPHIDSPISMLENLPASMRSKYSLVYESGTVASEAKLVSKNSPRILLRGGRELSMLYSSSPPMTKDLFLAFTVGSKSVEVIEFDGSVFKPYKLDFRNSDPNGIKSQAPSYKLGSVLGCPGCHIRKKSKNNITEKVAELFFRPNWEGYPLWKGLMGGIHSVFGSKETVEGGEAIVQEFKATVDRDTKSPYRNLVNWESISDVVMGEHNTIMSYAFGEANGSRIYHAATTIPRSAEFFELLNEGKQWYDRRREFTFDKSHVGKLSQITGVSSELLIHQLNVELAKSRQLYLEYFRDQELRVFENLNISESTSFRVERGEARMPMFVFLKLAWEHIAPAELRELPESWTMSFNGKKGVLIFETGTNDPFNRTQKLYDTISVTAVSKACKNLEPKTIQILNHR